MEEFSSTKGALLIAGWPLLSMDLEQDPIDAYPQLKIACKWPDPYTIQFLHSL